MQMVEYFRMVFRKIYNANQFIKVALDKCDKPAILFIIR